MLTGNYLSRYKMKLAFVSVKCSGRAEDFVMESTAKQPLLAYFFGYCQISPPTNWEYTMNAAERRRTRRVLANSPHQAHRSNPFAQYHLTLLQSHFCLTH